MRVRIGPLAYGTSAGASRAFLWCTRCGAIRFLFEDFWNLTLDHPEVTPTPAAAAFEPPNEDPTYPGTPSAKGGRLRWRGRR